MLGESKDVREAGRVAQRRARVRAEILDAARAIIREKGLAALALRDLAEQVGMRAPSLYSYFESKDAIYDALFAEGYQELLARQQAIADELAPLTPRDRLRLGSALFFDFCTEDSARYQLMFQRTIPGWEPSPEAYAHSVATLEFAATRLAEAGVTPEDLDLWTALTTGLTDQQISNDPGGDRWRRRLDEAVDMFCDHVRIP